MTYNPSIDVLLSDLRDDFLPCKLLREAAAGEIERLRKGIQDYLDGNYPHSRSYRPDACPHGLLWFNGDCDQCAEEHFQKLLARTQGESK